MKNHEIIDSLFCPDIQKRVMLPFRIGVSYEDFKKQINGKHTRPKLDPECY
jgi:hypothetical protein